MTTEEEQENNMDWFAVMVTKLAKPGAHIRRDHPNLGCGVLGWNKMMEKVLNNITDSMISISKVDVDKSELIYCKRKEEEEHWSEFVDFDGFDHSDISIDDITTQGIELIHALMLCLSEVREIGHHIFEYIFYRKDFDETKTKKEIGDLLFGVTYICNLLGTSVEECKTIVAEKLNKRYPNGYSDAAAIARADEKSDS